LVGCSLRKACKEIRIDALSIGRGDDADVHYEAGTTITGHEKLAGVDAIIVCSASFADTTVRGMAQNLAINVNGTLQLLELSVERRIPHFVFVSSVSAVTGNDSYGLTKAMAEQVLQQLCPTLDMKLTIVRPSQLYDTSGSAARHQPFLYSILEQVSRNRNITIYGSRDVERNYLHVDDLSAALIKGILLGADGVLHAVHPVSTKISEVCESARAAFFSSSQVSFDPTKPDLPEIFFPRSPSIFDVAPGLHCRSLNEGLREIALFRSLGNNRAT
jgi:nucleoside-diphosphate-sugar epimerase